MTKTTQRIAILRAKGSSFVVLGALILASCYIFVAAVKGWGDAKMSLGYVVGPAGVLMFLPLTVVSAWRRGAVVVGSAGELVVYKGVLRAPDRLVGDLRDVVMTNTPTPSRDPSQPGDEPKNRIFGGKSGPVAPDTVDFVFSGTAGRLEFRVTQQYLQGDFAVRSDEWKRLQLE